MAVQPTRCPVREAHPARIGIFQKPVMEGRGDITFSDTSDGSHQLKRPA